MKSQQKSGFTIVELLIVVVVIAVLAAITVVAYNGITNRAKIASIQSGLSSVKKKIENQRTTSGIRQYPGDLTFMQLPSTANFQYSPDITTAPYGYCLQATENGITYFVTQNINPTVGTCDQNFGIVGWWKFNGNIADSGPSAWTMTNTGAVSAVGQGGSANTAYSFNGTSQSVAANSFFTNGNSYGAVSISGWVYPPNNPGISQGYFGVRSGSDPQFYVSQKSGTNTLECRIWTTGGGSYVDAGAVSITPSAWNFVVLVYDGSSARCFVNGVAGTPTATTGSFSFTSNPFSMGYYLNGRLDDVRAFTRTLSTQEIQTMYTAGAQ